MPSQQDLCLLQDVKAWIYGNPTDNKWVTNADTMLSAYITAASRAMLTTLQRPTLVAHNVDEFQSGVGGSTILLKQYPLLGDLTSLRVNGVLIPKRPTLGSTPQPVSSYPGTGWVNTNPWDGYSPGQPPVIANSFACFSRGSGNIEAQYVAGYATLSEPAVVASVPPYTITPLEPLGRFAADISVIYPDFTPFTTANSVGTLAKGKYLPPQPPSSPVIDLSWKPVYQFAAADAGQAVFVSYSFTPRDLSYATMKWVGEWWNYKGRVGKRTEAMAGGAGTATFDVGDMPADIKLILNPYKSVVVM